MTPEQIRDLVNSPIPYELLTFEDGSQIYARMINEVSDQARKNLNQKYWELQKKGLV